MPDGGRLRPEQVHQLCCLRVVTVGHTATPFALATDGTCHEHRYSAILLFGLVERKEAAINDAPVGECGWRLVVIGLCKVVCGNVLERIPVKPLQSISSIFIFCSIEKL